MFESLNYSDIEVKVVYANRNADYAACVPEFKVQLTQREIALEDLLRRFVANYEFDSSVNDERTRFYNIHSAEYGQVAKLLRMIAHYESTQRVAEPA